MSDSLSYPIIRGYYVDSTSGDLQEPSTKLLEGQSITNALDPLKRRYLGKDGSDRATTPKQNNTPILIESSSSSESERDSDASIGFRKSSPSMLPSTDGLPSSKHNPWKPISASREQYPFTTDNQRPLHSTGVAASSPKSNIEVHSTGRPLKLYTISGNPRADYTSRDSTIEKNLLPAASTETGETNLALIPPISLPKRSIGNRSSSAPSGSLLARHRTSGQNRISKLKKSESVSDVTYKSRTDASPPSLDSKNRKIQGTNALPCQISKELEGTAPNFYPYHDKRFLLGEINNSLYEFIQNQKPKTQNQKRMRKRA